MAREYKVVAGLAYTATRVARAVTLCNDDSVLGAPFQMVDTLPVGSANFRPNSKRWAARASSTAVSTA